MPRASPQKDPDDRPYPAISLKAAREARDVAKEMLAHGLEPKPQDLFSRSKPAEDTRPTFEARSA
jgi:tryptophanyl-tRNA synthetase